MNNYTVIYYNGNEHTCIRVSAKTPTEAAILVKEQNRGEWEPIAVVPGFHDVTMIGPDDLYQHEGEPEDVE